MTIDPADPEIRAVILATSELTFPAIAASIAAKFGPERAWPVHLVAAVYRELRPINQRSRFERDPELIAFVAARADIGTLDDVRAAAVAAFGASRVPSRSHLQRLIVKIRDQAVRAAVRASR